MEVIFYNSFMDLLTICGVATALAMDAFSVSISSGAAIRNPGFGHYFRLSFHFGLFQFMMPIIGFAGGALLESYIHHVDHWVAFGLLAFIGIKMLKESLTGDNTHIPKDPSRGISLIMLSIATSIDALAVGISLGVLNKPILLPSIIIGAVCSLFSIAGVYLGVKTSLLLGRKAETIGGIMLILIGIKILHEHLC